MMTTKVRRPATVAMLQDRIASLEAELAIRERQIRDRRDHQLELTRVLGMALERIASLERTLPAG